MYLSRLNSVKMTSNDLFCLLVFRFTNSTKEICIWLYCQEVYSTDLERSSESCYCKLVSWKNSFLEQSGIKMHKQIKQWHLWCEPKLWNWSPHSAPFSPHVPSSPNLHRCHIDIYATWGSQNSSLKLSWICTFFAFFLVQSSFYYFKTCSLFIFNSFTDV